MTKKHQNWGWFFTAPYVVGLMLFTFIPTLYAGYISLTNYNMFNPPEWVGLKNFIKVWSTPDIWLAFRNILTYAIIMNGIQIFFGCILANLLNQGIKGTTMYRILYFIPALTPVVAVSFVWSNLYNPVYGLLNQLIGYIGIDPLKYCYSANWFEAVTSIAVMQGWKGLGYTTVYLLAGMQGISKDITEAAEVDGATGVKKFFKITMPMLSPTIFFLLMIGMINSIQVFEPFYLMQADTGANTEVIGTLIYNNAFVYGKAGYSAAIAWTSFLFVAVLTYIQKALEKRWVYYA